MKMSNEPHRRERTLYSAIHDEVAATASADGKVDEILRAARAKGPALSIATEQSIGDEFMEQMRRAAVMTTAEHRRGNPICMARWTLPCAGYAAAPELQLVASANSDMYSSSSESRPTIRACARVRSLYSRDGPTVPHKNFLARRTRHRPEFLHSGCAVASHRIDVLAIDLGTAQPVDHLRR